MNLRLPPATADAVLPMLARLLRSRRFAPLFWCQFFSVFNDNFVRNMLAMLILFRLGESEAGARALRAAAHACNQKSNEGGHDHDVLSHALKVVPCRTRAAKLPWLGCSTAVWAQKGARCAAAISSARDAHARPRRKTRPDGRR